MTTRREFIKRGTLTTAGLVVVGTGNLLAGPLSPGERITRRPDKAKRHFMSDAVEKVIVQTKKKLKDPKLSWMFENCFPNTLDTTVDFGMKNGKPDTFVITGDILAMWLRDSSAQVWPYLPLVNEDKKLKALVAGVINRQTRYVLFDSYANAFNKEEDEKSEWMSDHTAMKPGIHERKWEIDSLCYTVRLAYHYWKMTGDSAVFDADWKKAAARICQTFTEQQRKDGPGPYSFERKTTRQLDTLSNGGYGRPLHPVGLINSSFRPSDDASTYGFLIASNLFAVSALRHLAEMNEKVTGDGHLALRCSTLADEVSKAIEKYGVVEHGKYGKVYAYEVDGYGNATFMDDANVPGLLSLPYLGCVENENIIYQNTRKLILGENNPYFFKGKAAEGIGGPHVGYDMIWPMSIIMRAMTSKNDREISYCIKMLRNTDAGTGFMHESFHKDDPKNFTRSWFAWANTLFGELILKLVQEGKTNLLG